MATLGDDLRLVSANRTREQTLKHGPVFEVGLAPPPLDDVLPEPRQVSLMVDTGAFASVVSETIVKDLGLPAIDTVEVLAFDGVDARVRRRHIASLIVNAKEDLTGVVRPLVFLVPVIAGVGIDDDGVLGRDFLQHFWFRYRGPEGKSELVLRGLPARQVGGLPVYDLLS